jgi:hypothetical protein
MPSRCAIFLPHHFVSVVPQSSTRLTTGEGWAADFCTLHSIRHLVSLRALEGPSLIDLQVVRVSWWRVHVHVQVERSVTQVVGVQVEPGPVSRVENFLVPR